MAVSFSQVPKESLVISKVCICIVMPCWDDYRAQYDCYGREWPLLADICQGRSSLLGASAKIQNKIVCV